MRLPITTGAEVPPPALDVPPSTTPAHAVRVELHCGVFRVVLPGSPAECRRRELLGASADTAHSDSAVRPSPYIAVRGLYAVVARRSRRSPTDGLAPDR